MPSEMIDTGYAVPVGAAPEVASSQSGVSWAAIFAGGITAAAISVILVLFGTGLGLASVSPWAGAGVTAATFTVMAAIWLILVQWISAAFGGYMAGRLRVKWVAVHTEEVFFRDTAHGFLAWALGTLIVVGALSGVTGSAFNTGSHVAATVAGNTNTSNSYYVEMLFRQNTGGAASSADATVPSADGVPTQSVGTVAEPTVSNQDFNREASVILAEGAVNGSVPATDSTYLAQLVSEKNRPGDS